MDTKAEAFKGGKSGKVAVTPGKADESELIHRLLLPKDNDEAMPPEGDRLPPATIELLKKWITLGADWPDGTTILAAAETKPSEDSRPTAPTRPRPPTPELPKDFKPGPGEATAIAALSKLGVNVHPLAQNVPWTEANFRLMGTNITDKELAMIKDLPSLVELRLGTTKITDAGLAVAKNLPELQVLSLELTSVTDAGITHLKDLKNLVYLNLYGTAVTDAALDNLKDKKYLRSLYLWQTKVTEEGVKKLQEALPTVEINTGAKLIIISTNAPTEKKDEKKEEKK